VSKRAGGRRPEIDDLKIMVRIFLEKKMKFTIL